MPTKYLLLLLIMGLASCKSRNQQSAPTTSSLKYSTRLADSSQIKQHAFSIQYPTTGMVCYPTQNAYKLSFPAEVKIKSLYIENNRLVKKGTPLFSIEHPVIADLQQEYLTAKANFNRYKSNFTRQGELAIEQATTLKNMEEQEAAYLSFEAQKKAIEKKLLLFQINPELITADNITTTVKIVAPINGVLLFSNIYPGSVLKMGNTALTISNASQAFIETTLPAAFFPHVNKGDTLKILPWNDGIDTLHLTIKYIEPFINDANEFIVQSEVITNPGLPVHFRTQALLCLNTHKLVSADSRYIFNAQPPYILVKGKDSFDTITVNKGVEWDGRTQLINFPVPLNPMYIQMPNSKY